MSTGWRETFVRADDGTRLYVRRRGGDAPLTALLCDGIACDGFIWRFLVDDLQPLASVVHWHYRGHGRSSAPADPHRIEFQQLIADLNTVRRAHVSGPTVLFGHSMGCQLALEGYRSQPQQVAGLVLMCGAAGHLTHTFKGSDALAQALPTLIERVQTNPRLARALWSNFPPEVATRIALAAGEVDAAAIRPEDIIIYTEHVAGLDLLMFLRMLRSVGEQTAEDMLASVEVPALVIAGELDSFTPTYLAEKMAASLPQSELMILSGATHVVPIERRDLIRDAVNDFIRRRVVPSLDD